MQRSLGSQRPGDMTTLEKGTRNLRLWKQVTSVAYEKDLQHTCPGSGRHVDVKPDSVLQARNIQEDKDNTNEKSESL